MATSLKEAVRLGPDAKLVDWLDKIELEGKYWRDQALGDSDLYERLYFGKRKQLRTGDIPRFKANVIGPTVRRRNALLTEQKPVFKIEPLVDGLQSAADVLNELADFAWQDHGFAGALDEMVELASVFNAAGMSLPYDGNANAGLGSIIAQVRDPRSVLIDPGVGRASEVPKAKYVRIENIECIWDIQRDFPGRGMEVRPDTGVSGLIASPLNRSPTSSQSGPTSFRDSLQKLQEGPIPRAIKRVYFIQDPRLRVDGTPTFPHGRQIVRGGDIILRDGPSPFFDGEPDLVWFENQRDFSNIWGHNEIEALRYLQGAINRIGEMFVNNTVLMGNSRVVADSDALGNDVINRLTNVEALIITKRRNSTVDWQPPPNMPPHFLQFISFALRLVDYLIGLNDGQLEGRGRIEMRSGVQLEGLQNAAQVLIRAMARPLEEFIERLGKKFISRALQFYTKDRILLQTSVSGQWMKYNFEVARLRGDIEKLASKQVEHNGGDYNAELQTQMEDAGRKFRFLVQPMSSLASTKIARSTLLMQLVEAVMMPRRMVLKEAGFHNADELIQQAQQEAAQMAAMNVQPQTGAKKKSSSKKAA